MSARFELVHSDAGWFARFVASNGREIWRTSEVYTRRRGVVRAIALIRTPTYELRDVDERTGR